MELTKVWEKLKSVTHIQFRAQSGLANGWNGEGGGSVVVESNEQVLIFNEQGKWKSPTGQDFSFKNCYRWTFTSVGLQLEHLRLGIHNPVLLVELQSSGSNRWESLKPHICGDDLYSGILRVRDGIIELSWSVTGPRKCETLINIYT